MKYKAIFRRPNGKIIKEATYDTLDDYIKALNELTRPKHKSIRVKKESIDNTKHKE
jgi:hypothetical protein